MGSKRTTAWGVGPMDTMARRLRVLKNSVPRWDESSPGSSGVSSISRQNMTPLPSPMMMSCAVETRVVSCHLVPERVAAEILQLSTRVSPWKAVAVPGEELAAILFCLGAPSVLGPDPLRSPVPARLNGTANWWRSHRTLRCHRCRHLMMRHWGQRVA